MATWSFTLDRGGFQTEDHRVFGDDLDRLGSDGSLLNVWSATLAARSRTTSPRLLRARRDGRVVAAALIVICHDWGRSFFTHPTLRRAARFAPAIWYWERAGLATDALACPGLVAAGTDRSEFVGAAEGWLMRRYLLGCSIVPGVAARTATTLPWPGLGVSTRSRPWDRSALLGQHRNLTRKTRKFAHRGGVIERIHGRLPTSLHAPLLATYGLERPLNPPYIELYPAMVAAQWELDDDRAVHLVARLDGLPVGYHSFWRSGDRLSLLSGALGRPEGGTAHAYENLLLASLDLARDLDCTTIEYGACVNAVKASLLETAPTTMTFRSLVPGALAATALLLPRSSLAQHRIDKITRAGS